MHADTPSHSDPSTSRQDDPGRRPFLAADVGGTHARVGLLVADDTAAGGVRVLRYRSYACAEHAGLAEILRAFQAEADLAGPGPGSDAPAGAVVAAAGHVQADGTVVSANLPWPLSRQGLQERLQLPRLELINDFEAVAYATPVFEHFDALHLCGPRTAPCGPVLVVGPGTGLGAALWMPLDHQAWVVPTEAGQAGLAPGDATELALLSELMQRRAPAATEAAATEHVPAQHVPAESVLSGPGLVTLYTAMCALQGRTPVHSTPEAISAAALNGDDAQAQACLHTFCAWLGGTVGNLVLQTGARRVYLAGGILPRVRQFLAHSGFAARFCNKGAMRATLEQVPVWLVDHGQLGVVGAATWYLQRMRTR